VAEIRGRHLAAHVLKNRIKALTIAKWLLTRVCGYRRLYKRRIDGRAAARILHYQQMRNGAAKYAEGTPQYARFEGMIRAMSVSKSLIERGN
jgi:hypothetical protein